MIIPKATLYVTAADITMKEDVKLKILTEPSITDGEYGKKVECEIQIVVNGKTKPDRFKWTINDKNRNHLIESFGDESKKWVLAELLVMPGKRNSIQVYGD